MTPTRTSLRSAALDPRTKLLFGSLLSLIDNPAVRDLLLQVRHSRGELWIDTGDKLRRVPEWSCEPSAIRHFATELIAAGGRHLDDRNPIADVHIGEGIRVHAVLPPVSAYGTAISIRLPRCARIRFAEMVRQGLCSRAVGKQLLDAVQAKRNILVTGGTGSGKTTLLAAILDESDPGQRIVTIEDVAELNLEHPHHIALEARSANAEGIGSITLQHLLGAALRMRPDRIVLGECRGAEIVTLLAALNTGHDGGAGTLHASTISDVPTRLEALGALAGLTPAALARQAVAAVHLVVHLTRIPSGAHQISALGTLELQGNEFALRVSQ